MRTLDNLLESPTEPRVGYGSRQGLYSECDLVTVVAARLRIGEGRFGRHLEILRRGCEGICSDHRREITQLIARDQLERDLRLSIEESADVWRQCGDPRSIRLLRLVRAAI
jgi:hypothetical protein